MLIELSICLLIAPSDCVAYVTSGRETSDPVAVSIGSLEIGNPIVQAKGTVRA